MGGDAWIARLAGFAAVAVLTLGLGVATASAQSQPGEASASESSLEQQLLRRIEELEKARARYEEALREQERLAERVEQLEREKLAREGSAEGTALAADDTSLERRIRELEAERRAREEQRLEQRLEELETSKVAQEDATRSIIRQSVSRLGSNINEFVVLGGTFEFLAGWEQDFQRNSESTMLLNTAELDFEIQVADWVRGSLIFAYEDGRDSVFTTTADDEAVVDRINIDTAFVTLGDVERFWPYAVLGRTIVPFGISTGDPVLDAPTINDPLTIEIFESREDAVMIGAAFPTRPLAPPVEIPAPPKVRPLLMRPLLGKLAKSLGYKPLPKPPLQPEFAILPPEPPPFNVGVYAFQGDTFDRPAKEGEYDVQSHWGATMGYRAKHHCKPRLGRGLAERGQGWLNVFCPWNVDVDIDYNNSIFDSNLLSFEYQRWLDQIGTVPGLAASLKANLGPVGVVAEWNGALHEATFSDDLRRRTHMKPSAWQLSLVYQFDWNPWVETLATQGTYVTVGYSESRDMHGVSRIAGGLAERVGFVPEKRLLVGIGEWVTDGLRIAVEYAYAKDYRRSEGGTGHHANGVFTMLTYEW